MEERAMISPSSPISLGMIADGDSHDVYMIVAGHHPIHVIEAFIKWTQNYARQQVGNTLPDLTALFTEEEGLKVLNSSIDGHNEDTFDQICATYLTVSNNKHNIVHQWKMTDRLLESCYFHFGMWEKYPHDAVVFWSARCVEDGDMMDLEGYDNGFSKHMTCQILSDTFTRPRPR